MIGWCNHQNKIQQRWWHQSYFGCGQLKVLKVQFQLEFNIWLDGIVRDGTKNVLKSVFFVPTLSIAKFSLGSREQPLSWKMVEIVSEFGQAVLSTREMAIIQNSSESSFVSRKFEIYIFDNGFWFRLLIFIYLITRWVDKTLIFLIFRVWLRKSILRIPSFEILPNIDLENTYRFNIR